MSGWSPPSLPPLVAVALVTVWLLVLGYALLVLQNVLVGLLPGLLILVGYFAWRVLVALEAAADGLQRLADTQDCPPDGNREESRDR